MCEMFCCILRHNMRVCWTGDIFEHYKQYNSPNQPKPIKTRYGCGCTLESWLFEIRLVEIAGKYQHAYFAMHTANTMTQCKYLMPITSPNNHRLSFQNIS